ncbi:hypothetical protein SMD11_0283 [Streptomyces albireticuli]|uniref:Uncharacterized protein n=1 Tax=Streptomyces albireticuli TaxID=1940 RepID=A0A1Z2KV90_9ACTN|nr:hypothetical protein SMD11_0283 [Streptomyces albireticuli]
MSWPGDGGHATLAPRMRSVFDEQQARPALCSPLHHGEGRALVRSQRGSRSADRIVFVQALCCPRAEKSLPQYETFAEECMLGDVLVDRDMPPGYGVRATAARRMVRPMTCWCASPCRSGPLPHID